MPASLALGTTSLTPSDERGTFRHAMDVTATKKRDNVMRVRVSDEEREWLEQIAAREDRSLSNVLRLALKEFYQRRMDGES